MHKPSFYCLIQQTLQPKHEKAQKTAPLLVRSSIATTPCRKVTAAYALNYLELRPASLWFLNSIIAAIIARAANMMALVGIVLYNAIKEYYDDRTRKIIYFYSHTVENALKQQIAIHANYIENSRSNVTIPDDYHDNDVDDILMKCIDNKRQQYNTLIEDYNRAGKREDNIFTIDECRTGHSNKEDIEADEREEETRSIVTDSTWDEFAILAEEYTIDNRIVYALALTKDEWELELEDCDALVERYEEEINCSDLYSTV
ncbi:hypothetical protein HBI59_218950 [Parastagonospora nodorum]|nr:hypothetical protein HBI59_218950 [Parastagonospora nodorum]